MAGPRNHLHGNTLSPMHFFERCCLALRHNTFLEHRDWLWERLRPPYERTLARLGGNGLERNINGTDPLFVLPEFRGVSDSYEPEVWRHLMKRVRQGDVIADVGAHIGLYTIALAKRVGSVGRIFALEPDPKNFDALKAHIELNKVSDRVESIQAAAGSKEGIVCFESRHNSESRVHPLSGTGGDTVACLCLDELFQQSRLDILKIDVEGYEEEVLKGAVKLLQDSRRSPRMIYLEVHPYAWPNYGTTSDSFLRLLDGRGFQIATLEDLPVQKIESWGEIIASK